MKKHKIKGIKKYEKELTRINGTEIQSIDDETHKIVLECLQSELEKTKKSYAKNEKLRIMPTSLLLSIIGFLTYTSSVGRDISFKINDFNISLADALFGISITMFVSDAIAKLHYMLNEKSCDDAISNSDDIRGCLVKK